jgi:tRNA dimethylallyltransferase
MSEAAQDLRPILIAGPTASGKSALAMALAGHFGGTIINADSMQVYRELRVLTARPSLVDEGQLPHLLYGHVPVYEAYSAGRYINDATQAIADARAAGRRPIFVGGTGLYFKALLDGLSPIPAIPDEVRSHWRKLQTEHGAYALWTVLMDVDPEMALRLDPNDGQRIVRALEVQQATSKSLAEWQRTPGVPLLSPDRAVKLVLMPDRDELYARADARFEQMLTAGAQAEANALAALNLDPALPAMRALGVAPLIDAARGAMTLDAAITAAKAETRQYIKRQSTWIKSQMIAWKQIKTQEMESSIAVSIAFIQS